MNRNHHNTTRLGSLAAVALAIAFPFVAKAETPSSEWTWSVTPYVWATDVGVDVTIGDSQVIDETITVDELMEDVETIAQVRVEAQTGAHGFFVDLFDVNLADDAQTILLPSGGSSTLEPEMGMTILDLAGTYDRHGDRKGIQLLYGTRILNERATIAAEVTPASGEPFRHETEIDELYFDALAGFRYVRPIGKHVLVQIRADVSTGGTRLTWSAGPTIGYTFGETGRYSAIVGYRHMVVEFDTADAVEATMTLSGPLAGLRIAF